MTNSHPETIITALIVNPDGTTELKTLPVAGGSCLTALQQEVGGWIERVDCATPHGEVDLWADEEGLIKQKQVNLMAMWLAARLRGSTRLLGNPLVGTCVLTSSDQEGNTRSLTPEMQAMLEGFVDLFQELRIAERLTTA